MNLTEEVSVQKAHSIKCDKCGTFVTNNWFPVRHCFGYGGPADQTRLVFEICESCLLEITLAMIPDAKFLAGHKEKYSIETMKDLLENYRKWQECLKSRQELPNGYSINEVESVSNRFILKRIDFSNEDTNYYHGSSFPTREKAIEAAYYMNFAEGPPGHHHFSETIKLTDEEQKSISVPA